MELCLEAYNEGVLGIVTFMYFRCCLKKLTVEQQNCEV